MSSSSEEPPTANRRRKIARAVLSDRAKTVSQEVRPTPSPLCRSLSFTVEKPSLALLLWRGRCQDTTPKQNSGDGNFRGPPCRREILRQPQCGDVAHRVSPPRGDDAGTDGNAKNSHADEADTLADNELGWDASAPSTVTDGASLRSEPGSTSGSSSATCSHRNTEADDAEDESSDQDCNETAHEGGAGNQSATDVCTSPSEGLKSLSASGNRDTRLTSFIESTEPSAAELNLQTARSSSSNKGGEEECKVSEGPACFSSDLSMNIEDHDSSDSDVSFSKRLRFVSSELPWCHKSAAF